LRSGALAISLPSSCVLGLLSSIIASTMGNLFHTLCFQKLLQHHKTSYFILKK
jgi:hypothetical protein